MKCTRIIFSLVLALLFPLGIVAASLTESAKALARQSVSKLEKGRVHRVGVIPFVPTQERFLPQNELGIYYSESVQAALSVFDKNVRIFERQRLDAVMEELAFAQNVLISPDEAEKLGELIPVDLVLTGTWTVMGSSITVNGRFIDVTTGEVTATFTEKGTLSEKELSLIARAATTESSGISANSIDSWEQISSFLTSPLHESSVSKAVDLLMKVPFDSAGMATHRKALNRFTSLDHYEPRYGRFIATTVRGAVNIDDLYEFRAYIALNRVPDRERWNELLPAICRSQMPAQLLIPLFMSIPFEIQGKEQILYRLNQFCTEIKGGSVGERSPLSLNQGFSAAVEAIGSDYTTALSPENETIRSAVLLAIADSFAIDSFLVSSLRINPTSVRTYQYELMLKNILLRESLANGSFHTESYNRLIELIEKLPSNETTAYSILYLNGFLQELLDNPQIADSVKSIILQNKKNIKVVLSKAIKGSFPEAIRSSSGATSFIRYSVSENIVLDSLVPSVDQLIRNCVATTEENELLLTTIFLGDAGIRAIGAEEKAAQLLERSPRLKMNKSNYMARNLALFLGTISAKNPDSHRALISIIRFSITPQLDESGKNKQAAFSAADSMCRSVIAQIGLPVANTCIADLKTTTDTYARQALLIAIAATGSAGKSISAKLQAYRDSQTVTPDERDLLNDALQAISQ